MDKEMLIRDIFAREILDSRGNPRLRLKFSQGKISSAEPQFHPALQQENMRLWSFGIRKSVTEEKEWSGQLKM